MKKICFIAQFPPPMHGLYEVADFKLFSDQSVPAIMLHKDSIAFSVAGIREMNLKDNYVELLVHMKSSARNFSPTSRNRP